jgi:uncharacterized protein
MEVLRATRACRLPDWAIGAGVLRDLVWDELHGGFEPGRVNDVDVAFFDPDDLSQERDVRAERALRSRLPHAPWQAKNQAAVHTWYEHRFGIAVEPLTSTAEAAATWPETATAVAVRLLDDDHIHVFAPFGLEDLFRGIWRRNPTRVTVEESRRRLVRKFDPNWWPKMRIVD